MESNIGKINRQTVTDQVYDIIVRKIADGEWEKGGKIPSEIELSRELGVSRITLKMALQKLNALGIIETRVGEGSFVQDFSFNTFLSELLKSKLITDDSNELNQFRVLIEYCVLKLAIVNPIEEKKIATLETILNKMKAAIEGGDDNSFHKAHYQFHFTICEMSNNKLFIQLYESLKEVLFDVYKANSETTWVIYGKKETISHHQKLLDGIRNRDSEQLTELQNELLEDEYLKSK